MIMMKLMMSDDMKMESESQFSRFVASIGWEDAFIKEISVTSPTFIEEIDGGIVAFDSKFDVRALVCLPDNENKVVEFHFLEVEELSIESRMDILPTANFKHNSIEFRFIGNAGRCIRCRHIAARFIDAVFAGDCSLYSGGE